MNINAVSHRFSGRLSEFARAIRKRLLRSHRVPCQHFRLFVIVCIVLAGMKLWLGSWREIVGPMRERSRRIFLVSRSPMNA